MGFWIVFLAEMFWEEWLVMRSLRDCDFIFWFQYQTSLGSSGGTNGVVRLSSCALRKFLNYSLRMMQFLRLDRIRSFSYRRLKHSLPAGRSAVWSAISLRNIWSCETFLFFSFQFVYLSSLYKNRVGLIFLGSGDTGLVSINGCSQKDGYTCGELISCLWVSLFLADWMMEDRWTTEGVTGLL